MKGENIFDILFDTKPKKDKEDFFGDDEDENCTECGEYADDCECDEDSLSEKDYI